MQMQNAKQNITKQINELKQTQAKASKDDYKKHPNQITKTRKPIHHIYLQ